MQTLRLPTSDPHALTPALAALRAHGLVAFPTDTVYALGALAFDGAAIEAIYAAKERPIEKAIPVLLSDMGQLEQVASEVPPMARTLARRFWPGPLTLVVPKQPSLPAAISAGDTVAVRVPDHPVAWSLLRLAGPMAATSANRSGQPSPVNADQVIQQLDGRIPVVLDGGTTPAGIASTVVDCTGAEPVLLREGPLSLEQLLEAL